MRVLLTALFVGIGLALAPMAANEATAHRTSYKHKHKKYKKYSRYKKSNLITVRRYGKTWRVTKATAQKRCNLSVHTRYKRWSHYCSYLAPKKTVVAKASYSNLNQILFNNDEDNQSAADFFRRDQLRMTGLTADPVKDTVVKPASKKKPNRNKSWFKKDPVTLARKYEGLNARKNRRTLKTVLKVDPVRIPWCAAFANAMLTRAGYEGTGSLMARSFLKYGEITYHPAHGDIVVFSRGRRGGHVGFYVGETWRNGKKFIMVLGGNQRRSVNVALYPARRVLGYRKIA